jgi:hypothetical protein
MKLAAVKTLSDFLPSLDTDADADTDAVADGHSSLDKVTDKSPQKNLGEPYKKFTSVKIRTVL